MTSKAPLIQRVPCARHPDRVAAICHKCHDLAEQQRDLQWTKDRKVAHQEYLRAQAST